MNESLPTQLVVYNIILWFLAGRQLGHFGAKYARLKKESIVYFLFLFLQAFSLTIYLVYFYAG